MPRKNAAKITVKYRLHNKYFDSEKEALEYWTLRCTKCHNEFKKYDDPDLKSCYECRKRNFKYKGPANN